MTEVISVWRNALENMLQSHARLPYARFAQVATVRTNGRPANRTLTFRFFLSGNRLLFTADRRTEKITELKFNPWAEVCWYFTASHFQFRLLGKIQIVVDTEEAELMAARIDTWRERTAASRQSFTWPHAGQALAEPAAFIHAVPEQAPETFALLLFSPERVEILDLSQQPHAREVDLLEEGLWRAERINP